MLEPRITFLPQTAGTHAGRAANTILTGAPEASSSSSSLKGTNAAATQVIVTATLC